MDFPLNLSHCKSVSLGRGKRFNLKRFTSKSLRIFTHREAAPVCSKQTVDVKAPAHSTLTGAALDDEGFTTPTSIHNRMADREMCQGLSYSSVKSGILSQRLRKVMEYKLGHLDVGCRLFLSGALTSSDKTSTGRPFSVI